MTQDTMQITKQNDKNFRKIAGKIGLCLCLWLAIFQGLNVVAAVFSELFLYLGMDEAVWYVFSEILYMLAYIFGFVIPTLILRKLLRSKEKCVPIMKKGVSALTPLLIVAAIAINFAAAYMNSYLITLILPFQEMDISLFAEGADEAYEIVLFLISTAVIPALVEELLFRGVILSNLMPFGRDTAILGSAFLFGLMHGNILQFLYMTLMGVVLGYVYVKTESIWCCVLIHFFNNALSVVQETLVNCLEYDAATRWVGGLELAVLLLGAVSVILLILYRRRQVKPEDVGSFGVTFEPALAYEQYPLTRREKLKNFFAPAMIVFLVLSCVMMLTTLLTLMLASGL